MVTITRFRNFKIGDKVYPKAWVEFRSRRKPWSIFPDYYVIREIREHRARRGKVGFWLKPPNRKNSYGLDYQNAAVQSYESMTRVIEKQ